MDEGGRHKLQAALKECALHAQVLGEARVLLPHGFTPDDVVEPNAERRRLLDQVAFRFMKLQDSLGEKVLPGLLDLSLEPLPEDAPFVQKLNRLERLGALPSVDQWKGLREVRNALAHEYPDHPALQAAAWNRLLDAAGQLVQAWRAAQDHAVRLGVAPTVG